MAKENHAKTLLLLMTEVRIGESGREIQGKGLGEGNQAEVARRRWISPATGGTVKLVAAVKRRVTEVRYLFKHLPPYAMPPPAATSGGVLVLARHVARRCCHCSMAASSCVAQLCSALPFSVPN